MTKHSMTSVSALTFPTEFIIKVMGRNTPSFEETIAALVKKHYSTLTDHAFLKRPSSDANYVSISITVLAQSKEELDAVYQDLSDEPCVLMAL